MNLSTLIQKYDNLKRPKQHIDSRQTGLCFKGVDEDAEFIRDLDSLSHKDFYDACSGKDVFSNAIPVGLFLYNKYPRLFLKWDNGEQKLFFNERKLCGPMDGGISQAELRAAGGPEAFFEDIVAACKETPRDLIAFRRYLLADKKDWSTKEAVVFRSLLNKAVDDFVQVNVHHKPYVDSADEFVTRHDVPRRPFFGRSKRTDDLVGADDIKIGLDTADSGDDFVRDLDHLSRHEPIEFCKAIKKTSVRALRRYLYNKYPLLLLEFGSKNMNGRVWGKQIQHAGGMKAFLQKIDEATEETFDWLAFDRVLEQSQWRRSYRKAYRSDSRTSFGKTLDALEDNARESLLETNLPDDAFGHYVEAKFTSLERWKDDKGRIKIKNVLNKGGVDALLESMHQAATKKSDLVALRRFLLDKTKGWPTSPQLTLKLGLNQLVKEAGGETDAKLDRTDIKDGDK